MKLDDGISALPLWIDGHVYFNVADDFADVRDARSGEIIRHVPLCGAEEAQLALAAARRALPAWAALTETARRARLTAWGEALAELHDHFAQLLSIETGSDAEKAEAEVTRAVEWLRRPAAERGGFVCPAGGGIVALNVGADAPLVNAARALSLSLGAGAAAVVKPAPAAPSAVFALIELSSHVDLPAGVVNLIHGENTALDALASQPDVLMTGADQCQCG